MKEKLSKENEKKVKEKGNNGNIFVIMLYILLIILISMISFFGIYIKDKNKMSNILPEYLLGTDLNGRRNITIKVDDGTNKVNYDADGKVIESTDTTTEVAKSEEKPINDESILTIDNYQRIKDILIKRLEFMKVEYYEIKADENNGTIDIEVPEDSKTDLIAQYCVTKGEFKVTDSETEELLLTNSDVEKATVQYGSAQTSTAGTTVYLTIKFNKEGTQKLKDISKIYTTTTDEEGNSVQKKINMLLDDSTIISTNFDEEISDGIIDLSIGTSTSNSEIQRYVQQASNIAVFLNSEAMPITYKMEVNRFAYSDIAEQTINILIITMASIYALMVLYMIIKYKKEGLLGAVSTIGFIAILLILIRYANVTITLPSIIAIAIPVMMEYVFLMRIFKENNQNTNNEIKNQNIKKIYINESEKSVLLMVIAIVFALVQWEPIYSVGMMIFWGIAILIIYNFLTFKINLLKLGKRKEN